ncbi:hypothetical protein [Pandoraea iniqua]|nr:hypothetical protein [Pandoraea iniqua]
MPDYEDSPDKSRRNLLTLSAATITGFYLEPKLQSQAKLLGVLDVEHITPAKFWLVVLVLLVYFFARFTLSEPLRKAVRAWRNELASYTERRYAREFAKFAAVHIENPKTSHPVLQRQGTNFDQFHNMAATGCRWTIGKGTVAFIGDGGTYGKYKPPISFHQPTGVTVVEPEFWFHVPEDFLLSSRRLGWIKTQATSSLIFEAHLPILLGLVAIGLVVFALIGSCTETGTSCLW